MDVRLLFPNEYISAADLIEAQKKSGRDGVTLTISTVKMENLKTNKGTERKPVVSFVEFEQRAAQGKGENKRLVMNKTNARLIAKLHGNETNDWVGKRITLWPTQCEAFGATVDCVRVMPHTPQDPKRNGAKAAPVPSEEIELPAGEEPKE